MTHPLKGRKQSPEHIAKRVKAKWKPLNERLENNIHKSSDGCWLWTGTTFRKPNTSNYGCVSISTGGIRKVRRAHIVSYEHFVGSVPKGLELDHLCHNTLCINPEHLEPVTHTENMRRRVESLKSHCKRGHTYTTETAIINEKGWRSCRICKKEDATRFYEEKTKIKRMVMDWL